ncbi:11651_t:CDS:2, partial [Dentiscutata erythropus]
EEPTITEVQEELPKENIPVPNLKKKSKKNAENLANLDTIMIHTEEVTKKNDKTDDKLKSLYIQEENLQTSYEGRVITADILYKKYLFKITNVYALPNMKDRTAFFENWIPPFDEDKINIIAENFNTNLDPTINRISQANAQNNPS